MKYFIALALATSNLLLSDEKVFQKGDIFEARKFEAITLYFYRSDATRLDTARDFAFSLNDFMDYAAIDQRDLYKIRRGETFQITESFKNGDIFQVNLDSSKSKREKYFVLSEDLENRFLTRIDQES
jgi:hypothetical protein